MSGDASPVVDLEMGKVNPPISVDAAAAAADSVSAVAVPPMGARANPGPGDTSDSPPAHLHTTGAEDGDDNAEHVENHHGFRRKRGMHGLTPQSAVMHRPFWAPIPGSGSEIPSGGPGDTNMAEIEPEWVASLWQDLAKHVNPAVAEDSCCIYEIPRLLRQVDYEAYRPYVVDLGPLDSYPHMGYAIEEQELKLRYLAEAVSKAAAAAVPSVKGEEMLKRFLREIKGLEQRARKCYSKTLDHIDSKEFIQIMLLDGCFIIQLLLKETHPTLITADDPIFQQRWLFLKVRRDLLLLTNQIPFLVLQTLFKLVATPQGITDSLLAVIQDFFKREIKGSGPLRGDNPLHLLHLLHSNLFPDVEGRRSNATVPNLKPFPGATQLAAAGVKFGSSNGDRLDITFDEIRGVLKIPQFAIDDDTKSLLLNLTAFEQLHPDCSAHVTAYIMFMHCLLNSAQDVAVLCRKGIIYNWLGSEQQVVDLFNELGKNITIYPNEVYLAAVMDGIHKYAGVPWNAWRASFTQNFLTKPWAIFSLAAAILLLILTLLQTIFSIYQSFKG